MVEHLAFGPQALTGLNPSPKSKHNAVVSQAHKCGNKQRGNPNLETNAEANFVG
jgi:hypothetical protein